MLSPRLRLGHASATAGAAVRRALLQQRRRRSGDLHRSLGIAASAFHDPRRRRRSGHREATGRCGGLLPHHPRAPPPLLPAGGPLGGGTTGPPPLLQRRTFVFSDLSVAELGMIVVVASVFINRKDLPVLAKGAGKVVGSAVGQLLRAKQALTSFSEVSDIAGIRKELQEGVAELRSIRQDIYGLDVPPPRQQAGQAQQQQQPQQQQQQQHTRSSSTPTPASAAQTAWQPDSSSSSSMQLPSIGAASTGSDIMQQAIVMARLAELEQRVVGGGAAGVGHSAGATHLAGGVGRETGNGGAH